MEHVAVLEWSPQETDSYVAEDESDITWMIPQDICITEEKGSYYNRYRDTKDTTRRQYHKERTHRFQILILRKKCWKKVEKDDYMRYRQRE